MTKITADGSFADECSDKYELHKCAEWIASHDLRKVCLQFPDDLLCDSVHVALSLEKLISKKVYILGDTSYGSCCVDEIAAQHINADGIIHFGHACLSPTTRLPVFHVFPKKHIDVTAFCDKFQTFFEDRTDNILFFYDCIYAHAIGKIYTQLKPKFINLVMSSLNCTSGNEFVDANGKYQDTVTMGRCWVTNNEFTTQDCKVFYLGDNGKTVTALALSIPARRWHYLQNDDIVDFDISGLPWLKRRRFLVEKLKDAQVVGIVVATLGIEKYLGAIERMKKILKEKNKKTYVISVGKINPTKLANFPEIDAFVAITCPESEIFDSREFSKPVLLPYEVDLAFNASRGFSFQYPLDFREILPGGKSFIEFQPTNVDDDSDVSLISNSVRTSEKTILANEMNALVLPSLDGTVGIIGKAGAQFLQERSWKGVEQRLGKNSAQVAEMGRSGLASHYTNEPVSSTPE